MAHVEVQDEIDASKEKVWELVSDFGGVGRISADVESCEVEGEGVGAVRTIRTSGVLIQERLESLDDDQYVFSYSMLEGPIPFKDYLAHVSLSDAGPNRTAIKWAGSFEPVGGVTAEQLEPLIQGIYRGLIAGVKKVVAGP